MLMLGERRGNCRRRHARWVDFDAGGAADPSAVAVGGTGMTVADVENRRLHGLEFLVCGNVNFDRLIDKFYR